MKENLESAYGYAKKVWKRGAAEIEAATPHFEKAVSWGKQQHGRLSPHIPTATQVEIWAKDNAARFGWNEKPKANSLTHLEQTLNAVVAAHG